MKMIENFRALGQKVFQMSFSLLVCISSKGTAAEQLRVENSFESSYCSKANFNLVIKIAFCIQLNVIQ